jgi:hypothetical protein
MATYMFSIAGAWASIRSQAIAKPCKSSAFAAAFIRRRPIVYWNGRVYILAGGDYLSVFPLDHGRLTPRPSAMGVQRFCNPGATPAISANGTSNGIVWLIETKTWNGPAQPAILHAYDAADITRELYNTEQNSARDRMGMTLRFTVPTVVNGRVYVNAKRKVDFYGLLAKH